MKIHIRGFFFSLLFSALGIINTSAQNNVKYSQLDSTVTVSANGDVRVSYSAPVFDFGAPIKVSDAEKRAQAAANEAAIAQFEKKLPKRTASRAALKSAPRKAAAGATSYAVGAIPLQEGVTPSGGKTYQIPITTAPGFKLTPSVAVGYNSQASDGWVGYGWDVYGSSFIKLISKNKYYHGENKGADRNNTDAVFALDGVPLVQNVQPETKSAYPLITASGNILVAPTYNSYGVIISFAVKYPNGTNAIFMGGYASDYYNQLTYPISQLTDPDGNKITFHYGTYSYTSRERLDAIRYGYDASDQYKAEIVFSYADGSSFPNGRNTSRYYAGQIVEKKDRLSSIVSKNCGEVICEYAFSYEEADRVSLLSRVDCSADGESLPPLQFEYGSTGAGSSEAGYLYQAEQTIISSAFQGYDDDVDFVYKRGKFMTRGDSDGLLIYPQYDNYVVKKATRPFLGSWRFLFGSPYDPEQKILFVPSLNEISSQAYPTISVGEGFQTIDAVDVDGDGIDELVKVNFNGISGNSTRLLITVYECDDSNVPAQSFQFNVYVQGTIKSEEYTSPYRREYFWGDFMGNGKVQLLTVAYDKNYNGLKLFDQVSYASLIDISSRAKLCETRLFDYSLEHSRYLLVCDLDKDSQTELCFTTLNGLDVYRFQPSSRSFAKERTVTGISQSFWNYNDRPYFFTDLQGDGYLDILCPPEFDKSYDYWEVRSYNGHDFSGALAKICPNLTDDKQMFIDVNQDGLADLVRIHGTSLETYINDDANRRWIQQQSPSSVADSKGIVPANVVDFLGESCFIKVDGFYAKTYQYSVPSPQLRQLKKSTDSYGRTTVNTYVYLPERLHSILGGGWWDNSFSVNNADGYIFKTLPIYVLEKEDSYLAGVASAKYKSAGYSYFNSVVHNQGLGFCGFSMIRSVDLLRNVYVDEVHDPQKRGVVTSVKTRLNSIGATPFNTITNTYDNNSTTYGKLNPRLTNSVANNTLTGITTTTSYTYGDYDLPTKIVTSRRIGTGAIQKETVSRTYQNTVTANKYILGLVTEESIVKEGDGDNTQSWSERTVNTYDSNSRLTNSKHYVGLIERLTVIKKGPDEINNLNQLNDINIADLIRNGSSVKADPIPIGDFLSVREANNLVSETRWTYDSFGNVATKKTASYGSTTFLTSTFTYDSDGRYLLTEKDAFGHATTYSDYNKFGKPATVKDYRNRTTTYVYDAWGAVIKKTYPDGTVEQSTPAWGGAGLYTVTSTATGRPQTVVHYDALGREVRTGQKRFNGQWQYVDKVYDIQGRLQKTSLPYRGSSATYWNTYHFDDYGRPLSVEEASGKVTTWSYSGVNTTTVKDGISSTSTTDPSGNVIRLEDKGGVITYILRDDGQPASITAPGNVTTSFTYDDYGRRTQISDPSAGVQTDSYVWNSDGSSVQTHVGPNGTVKTYVDKYGRTTKVERPGEYSTTYTYNSYNLLTKEQSTNGTSAEYTYDAKDRVSTMKETIPDGKWLKKTYTYTSGSALSKIAYESQSGAITTETYTYANGYNTKISLADGTVVWSLTAENDLGMPTTITSGSITREYGYTAFGMPTYRRMGTLQDMRYQFDPQTGNLLSRRDETRDKTESFKYDELNRLKTINARQITYDAKGNILRIGGVGTMTYDDAHPYQITSLTTTTNSVVANRAQSVSYTSYNRPSVLTEGSRSAAFTYNGDGDRVKMYMANGSTQVLTRYYIGGQYEFDQTPNGTKERLYVGGDAYSAPMVYQREDSGSWAAYNIGRDYLGNITHIATATGTLVAEYSYDPWGRLRNPSTLSIYAPGKEPELFLGRGFTGHEHLSWFGLINMNARLYDPVVGRFLSPDPYVQAPDFTQNFNRYSYALNNPLKYTDESGEVVVTTVVVAALASAAVCMAIDYGLQVLMNYIQSYRDPTMTNKDIFLNKIDWFDVGMSGLLGAFTGGTSAVATAAKKAGTAVPKLAEFALKYRRAIEFTEGAITSAIDITGEGWQKVSFDDYMKRMVLSVSFTAVSDVIADVSSRITSAKTPTIPDDAPLPPLGQDLDSLPYQEHHFASNKNKTYTPQYLEIANKYGLKLDGDWNKEVMKHLGRHPNEYHDFVLRMMQRIDIEAAGNQKVFLDLYEVYVKQVIRDNPKYLRKAGWIVK